MKMQRVNVKCKCDFGLCKKDADYVIYEDGVMSRRKVYICKDCARDLLGLLEKEFVPKSPINIIKRSEQNRKECL